MTEVDYESGSLTVYTHHSLSKGEQPFPSWDLLCFMGVDVSLLPRGTLWKSCLFVP